MTTKQKENLISWLNNAYAMEHQTEEVLEHRLEDDKDMPQAQAKIEEHLDETRIQKELIRQRIEALGGKPSAVKSKISEMSGYIGARSTGIFDDDEVKNGIADYANENMEYASYKAIEAGAEAIGDQETATLAHQIAEQEKDMAEWVASQMPMKVQKYLAQTA